MTSNLPFTDVATAIEEVRAGRMIVVVDDEDRENEGDLTLAAEKVTPEAINFMAKHGRGLVCLAMKLMASGVTFSAARVRSPSFSRSSSSTTTIIRPARISSIAVGTSVKGE